MLPFWGCPIVFDVHNCSNFNISHISYFALGKPFAFSSFLILIVDHLYTAIIERKKVTFQYFDYTPEKKKVHRHDGQLYTVSPYAMLWKLSTQDKHLRIALSRMDLLPLCPLKLL